jgi:class 3 adenylate cyclase
LLCEKIINIVNDKMNKTSISSVVCFDIIDFAKKSEAEQQAAKKQFNALVDLAVVDIPEKDRMIVDTGHGAIVACSGSLENALEDALFIALTVRDEVLNGNTKGESPLYLLIGINLGSVKVASSTKVNDVPNIIGDGLVEAQRIMSFAKPNQILVSRAYYDMASKLTLEIAQMFEKYDMHAYEHDIYAVRLLNEKATVVDSSVVIPEQIGLDESSSTKRTFNWSLYALPVLLGLAMLFAFTKWMQHEDSVEETNQPTITMQPSSEDMVPLTEDNATTEATQTRDKAVENTLSKETASQEQSTQTSTAEKVPAKNKVTQKAAATQQKPTASVKSSAHQAVVTDEKAAPVEPASASNQDSNKSGWQTFKESFKQGSTKECTQAERAMNQCN